MKTKNELRAIAKNIRRNLNMKDISGKILNDFLASTYYNAAKNIAIYYPIGTELDLTPLFSDKSKNFCLPKISDNKNEMVFIKYQDKKNILQPNKYGIMEPIGEIAAPAEIDLIILPALMADKTGCRLGYGGGYYDRYLQENNIHAVKIILLPDKLLTDELPKESFDIPADIIITEKQIIKTKEK